MKTSVKKSFTTILAVVSAALASTCSSVYAENISNYTSDSANAEGNPVIGEYIGDPELEAFVAEKEALAEQYYEAICSGDTERIASAREKFSNLEASHSLKRASFTTNSNSRYGPPPSSYTISLTHYRQENGHYCGPATAYMILKKIGVKNITQDKLASSLKTTINGTGWYLSDYDDPSDYPMMTTLNQYQGYKYYTPSPLGKAGKNPLPEIKVKSYVMSATSYDYPIALCGISKASGASHIPNYPSKNINHWLTCIGYSENGSKIRIDDPASQISQDFANVPNKYNITSSNCKAFIEQGGMIW